MPPWLESIQRLISACLASYAKTCNYYHCGLGDRHNRGKPMRAWYLKASFVIACAALIGTHAARGAQRATGRTSSTLISRQSDPAATLSVGVLGTLLQKQFASRPTLQSWIGKPKCGVRVYKFLYATVDGQGEATDASGALMVPRGSTAQCRKRRPIVLSTHGTEIDRAADVSALGNPGN